MSVKDIVGSTIVKERLDDEEFAIRDSAVSTVHVMLAGTSIVEEDTIVEEDPLSVQNQQGKGQA